MTRADSQLIRVRSALVEAHRADQGDPADIQRAYLRFSWARRKAPAKLPLLRWLVAGVAIGVGVASAASLAPKLGSRSAAPLESASVSHGGARHHPLGSTARGGNSKEPGPSAEAAGSPARPLTELSARSGIAAPGFRAQRAPALSSAASTASASAPENAWERAAVALRNGDLAAAEAALANLEQSDNLLDRQAAELARAQLLVKRGRAAEARSTLQRLARDGGSALIRSQAASTLRSLGD